MKKIAILIDFWSPDDLNVDPNRIMWETTSSFLKKNYVDTVIISTYDTEECIQVYLSNPWIEQGNPWIEQTRQYFRDNNLCWDSKLLMESKHLFECGKIRETNSALKHTWKEWNKPVLFLAMYWEIGEKDKIEKDKIEEVFFFGSAWDRCVKVRPLGYDMWLNNTSANLYFDPDGVRANAPPKFEEYQNSIKYPNLKTLREV